MNIYFSGIGGVGIGPLSMVAQDAGHTVSGSDQAKSPLIVDLRRRGVEVEVGRQDGMFLRETNAASALDLFVYTAALPADHPELQTAKELGIKTVKRDELLVQILKEKNLKLIAASGTHGKTTTTGMLVWALQQLGIPISYLIGTTLSWGPSGKYEPGSEYFVYECDEFDRNFLHFSPYLSIVTTLDYDHPDTYPSEKDYLDAFKQFSGQSKNLVTWQSQHGDLFSSHPDAWLLADDEVADIKLAGEHNRRNATLVLKAVEKLKLAQTSAGTTSANKHLQPEFLLAETQQEPGAKPFVEERSAESDLKHILEGFPGTSRRFEKLADNLYSDYGHHPIEIVATLQLARELSDHVVLVYQPHQNIRQHEIRDQYTPDVFKDAETVYWLPTYLSRENPDLEILTPEALAGQLENVSFADLNDELWQAIQTVRNDGKLVLCMGAGSIDSWLRSNIDNS